MNKKRKERTKEGIISRGRWERTKRKEKVMEEAKI